MNMKFRISSSEQSARLQEKLFEMGYGWGQYLDKIVESTDKAAIYTDEGSWHLSYSSADFFNDDYVSQHKEQDTEAFIAEHSPKPAIEQPVVNDWRPNTGVMPVSAHIQVDVELRDGSVVTFGFHAGGYCWSTFGEIGDIIKWRFHSPADEHLYFVQPATEGTSSTVEQMGERIKAALAISAEEKPVGEFSGGNVNYYLLNIDTPKRLSPYECEAEDIIEALGMTFAEGNVFKALWRSCAMRVRGHGKAGQDEHGVYDGDKIAYYGERVKVQRRRSAGEE